MREEIKITLNIYSILYTKKELKAIKCILSKLTKYFGQLKNLPAKLMAIMILQTIVMTSYK